jgi:hypothetical protein
MRKTLCFIISVCLLSLDAQATEVENQMYPYPSYPYTPQSNNISNQPYPYSPLPQQVESYTFMEPMTQAQFDEAYNNGQEPYRVWVRNGCGCRRGGG